MEITAFGHLQTLDISDPMSGDDTNTV
jgi:hypothetical protein